MSGTDLTLSRAEARLQSWKSLGQIVLPSALLAWLFACFALTYVGSKYGDLPLDVRRSELLDWLSGIFPLFDADQRALAVGTLVAVTAALLAVIAAGYIAIAINRTSFLDVRRQLSSWTIGICIVWLPGAVLTVVSFVTLRDYFTVALVLPLMLALLWLAIKMAEFGTPTLEQRQLELTRSLRANSERKTAIRKTVDKFGTPCAACLKDNSPTGQKSSPHMSIWGWVLLYLWQVGWRGAVLTTLVVLSMQPNWELFGVGGIQISFQVFVPLGLTFVLMLSTDLAVSLLISPVDGWLGRLAKGALLLLKAALFVGVACIVAAWAYGCAESLGCQQLGGSDFGYWLPLGVFLVVTVLMLASGRWRGMGWAVEYEVAVRKESRLSQSFQRIERLKERMILNAALSDLDGGRCYTKKEMLKCISRNLPPSPAHEEASGQAKKLLQELLQEKLVVQVSGRKGCRHFMREHFHTAR